MKVLFVTTISDTINSFLIPHINFLIRNGCEVGIAANVSENASLEMKGKCLIHDVSFQRNPFHSDNLTAYLKIRKIVVSSRYDLIHAHTPVAAFITRAACKHLPNVKILYTAHGFHFFKGASWRNRLIYQSLERIAAKWTDGLITMNGEDYTAAKQFTLRQNANRVFGINGIGVNLKKFSPAKMDEKMRLREKYDFLTDEYILIYAGELSYRKHQDLLIEAVGVIVEEIPSLKLLLVGDGPMEQQLKQLSSSLGLDENIQFLGYRHDVEYLMKLSDVAVSTSRQEGLPVNVMEAMATGLPLIVSNCRGNRDLVENEVNGLVIESEDKYTYAEAIIRLFNAPAERHKFGACSTKLVEAYSIERVLEEMKIIYRQLDENIISEVTV